MAESIYLNEQIKLLEKKQEIEKENQYRNFMFGLTQQYLNGLLNCGKNPDFTKILKDVENCLSSLKQIEEKTKYVKVPNPLYENNKASNI